MRIAILELYHHSEVAFGWTRLALQAGYEVWLFGRREWIDWRTFSEEEPVQVHAIQPHEGIPDYLKKIEVRAAACDLILISTMASHFQAFAKWNPGPKKILLLHSLNSLLRPAAYRALEAEASWKAQVIYQARLYRERLYEIPEAKREALRSMDGLTTPSIELEAQLKTFEESQNYKWISPIPWVWPEYNNKDFKSGLHHIVLPGTVRQIGRDFELLLQAIQMLPSSEEPRLKMTLAGKVEGDFGRRVVNRLQFALQEKGILQFALNGYPQMQYEEILQSADVLLLPLRKTIPLGLHIEYYGSTNISGGVNDSIRFQKPVFIPDWYRFPVYWEGLAVRYGGAGDLAEGMLQEHGLSEVDLGEEAGGVVELFRGRVSAILGE